ncbi:MAG: preprotein translocase subunit YajC [Phycisphaerales bacterium]|nr:preprotein translocase subunit YajC [Phycisphaerales bacterium]
MIVVFYMVMIFGSRKDKKKRQDMLAAIKKNDRVMTIGGIIGSVVSTTDSEVTLKVDESANVKITFIRSAIQKVLTEGEKPGEGS